MYLAEQFRLQTSEASDPLDDPEVLNDLFLQAERGKKTLTQREKAPFRVTHAGQQARVELDRAKFEEISRHLLDRTIELTHEMLADARGKGHTTFDKIILVGGATRMPQVHNRIVAEFNMEPESYDPDEAVAKGAALYGLKESLHEEVSEILASRDASLSTEDGPIDLSEVPEEQVAQALDHLEKQLGFTLTGPVRELVSTRIVNVLSKSLGVIARDDQSHDVVVYLLPRNSEVPMERISDFGTDAANQAAVDIRVMAGERDSTEPTDCQEVGLATLNLPEKLPARSPIRVKFAINQDGRLNVSAIDLTAGGSIDVEFQTEAVLNAERGRGAIHGAAAADGIMRGGLTHVECSSKPRHPRCSSAIRPPRTSDWEGYQSLLKILGDRPVRMTYDRGTLELMTPLPIHERYKSLFGRLVEILTEELELPLMLLWVHHLEP